MKSSTKLLKVQPFKINHFRVLTSPQISVILIPVMKLEKTTGSLKLNKFLHDFTSSVCSGFQTVLYIIKSLKFFLLPHPKGSSLAVGLLPFPLAYLVGSSITAKIASELGSNTKLNITQHKLKFQTE